MRDLLNEIAALSEMVSVRLDGLDSRRPSFSISRAGADMGIRFAAIPMGHEFTSLVLALLQVGGHPPRAEAELVEQVRALDGEFHFETFYSLTCQNCPDTVQSLNAMSVLNPRIHHVAIDGARFQAEVEARSVMAVPTVFLNGEVFGQGRMSMEQIVALLDTGAADRAAAAIAEKDPFDVLIVGGGPAGAAAAVYAARKGIRTGVAAERFGGQVLDTMGIENLVSVTYTEGPKLAAALEAHVREYDVDVMNLQRARALVPAAEPGGLVEVALESGSSLFSRTVVLSTGARWRQMGVPGEDEYRNRGVAYCPHCDGPLYKGKRVAVIGGGNSGVEAAIDLAGIVDHVTLIEFDHALRADDVLQRKLRSLPNVTVVVGALTTEVLGDGTKVTGLVYRDRTADETATVSLDGIFVQIGLLPNTEWLRGIVELLRRRVGMPPRLPFARSRRRFRATRTPPASPLHRARQRQRRAKPAGGRRVQRARPGRSGPRPCQPTRPRRPRRLRQSRIARARRASTAPANDESEAPRRRVAACRAAMARLQRKPSAGGRRRPPGPASHRCEPARQPRATQARTSPTVSCPRQKSSIGSPVQRSWDTRLGSRTMSSVGCNWGRSQRGGDAGPCPPPGPGHALPTPARTEPSSRCHAAEAGRPASRRRHVPSDRTTNPYRRHAMARSSTNSRTARRTGPMPSVVTSSCFGTTGNHYGLCLMGIHPPCSGPRRSHRQLFTLARQRFVVRRPHRPCAALASTWTAVEFVSRAHACLNRATAGGRRVN